MDTKILESLADELFVARDEYNDWVKYEKASRKDGTTWSKVDHLSYGDARGRYSAVLRVLKTIGILTDVDEILTDRFFDSYKAERGV